MPPNPSSDARAEMIATLLATPPPRQVPPEIRKLALGARGAGCTVLFGLVFAAFGMVFVVAFFPWRFWSELQLRSDAAATAPGTIVTVEATSFSINDSQVMRNVFEFRPAADAGAIRGECYTTGEQWSVDDGVDVRYLPEEPTIACVVGGRLSKSTWWIGLFPMIFPLVGGGLVVAVWRHRHTTLRTLHRGVTLEAQVIAVEPTQMAINDNTVFKISLARTDRPSDRPLVVKRHDRGVVARARRHLETKQPMYILVDPEHPKRVLLPETW